MRKHKVFLFIISLIALGIACSTFSSSNTNNNGESTKEVIIPTSTTTFSNSGSSIASEEDQQQDLPPLSFTEFFEAGVETGQWTYEEGLASILQYVAGAGADDEFSGVTEVIEPEANGIVRLAIEYLERPDADPELASEIDHYLRILFPPLDVLEQISRPKGSASSHRLGSSQPLPLQQNQDACEDLALAGYDPDQLENAEEFTENPFARFFSDCYVYVERQLGDQRIRVYYPASWEGDDAREHRVLLSLEALAQSSNTYKGLAGLTVKDLNLAFALSPYETAKGFANFFDPETEACPIAMLPLADQYTDDQFSQAVAHETFHCVQFWSFPNSKPYNTHSWWLEGSAEYFSNLAYPGVNLESRNLDYFDSRSTGISIFDLTYENYPFFQFMGNKYSPEGLINILLNVSAAGGRTAQEEALANASEMDSNFNLFVVEYLSTGILDSGGGRITKSDPKVSGKRTVDEKGTVEFTVQPFVAMRYHVDFKQEKRFLQSPLDPDATQFSSAKYKLRKDPGAWSNLPPEIRSECDKDVRYIFVPTTTKSNSYTAYDVDVTLAEKASCDPCLLGTWDVDPVSYANAMEKIMAQADTGGVEINLNVSGHQYLQFDTDGKVLTEREDFAIIANGIVTTTLNGSGGGNYSADGEKLVITNFLDVNDSVGIGFFGARDTNPYTDPSMNEGNLPQNRTAEYTCEQDTLMMTLPDLGELLFHRVDKILPTPVPTPAAPDQPQD